MVLENWNSFPLRRYVWIRIKLFSNPGSIHWLRSQGELWRLHLPLAQRLLSLNWESATVVLPCCFWGPVGFLYTILMKISLPQGLGLCQKIIFSPHTTPGSKNRNFVNVYLFLLKKPQNWEFSNELKSHSQKMKCFSLCLQICIAAHFSILYILNICFSLSECFLW